MIQFLHPTTNAVLLETSRIASGQIIPQVEIIEQKTVTGYRIIQRIKGPQNSFKFDIAAETIANYKDLRDALHSLGTVCKLTCNKVNFGLETPIKGYIKFTAFDDSQYLAMDHTNPNRLCNFSFEFTPFM